MDKNESDDRDNFARFDPPNSWIVEFWARVFKVLGMFSIMRLVLLLPLVRQTYSFVETYVFLNSVASGLLLFISCLLIDRPVSFLAFVVFAYACLRIFEVVIYQMNVLLFDEYRAKKAAVEAGQDPAKAYAVRGYRRTVILLLHNYFEIICWFGIIYTFFYRSGDLSMGVGLPDPTFFSVFRDSLLLMFSFNADWQQPITDRGLLIFSLHATVGVFMTILAFARFLALLPPPKTIDDFER